MHEPDDCWTTHSAPGVPASLLTDSQLFVSFRYLVKNSSTLFSASDYEVAPPEYHRKAVWELSANLFPIETPQPTLPDHNWNIRDYPLDRSLWRYFSLELICFPRQGLRSSSRLRRKKICETFLTKSLFFFPLFLFMYLFFFSYKSVVLHRPLPQSSSSVFFAFQLIDICCMWVFIGVSSAKWGAV